MTQAAKKKTSMTKRIVSIVLFVLSAVLIITSIAGFVIRGMDSTAAKLNEMRTSAVVHVASGGLVDGIAAEANAAKLKELRALPNFRSMGMDEVKALCAEAEAAARAEAEALYSDVSGVDTDALVGKIDALESALTEYNELSAAQKATYAELYTSVYESVADWTNFVGESDDEALFAALTEQVPGLGEAESAIYKDSFVRMARDLAAVELEKENAELYEQLFSAVTAAVADWSSLSELTDDEALWAKLVELTPELNGQDAVREQLLTDVKAQIAAAASGEVTTEAEAETEEAVEETATETVVDYGYFVESEAVAASGAVADAAFDDLWAELVKVIPDLDGLDKKTKNSIQETMMTVVSSGSLDFSTRYDIYAAQKADSVLSGGTAFQIKLAANAGMYLIAGIALLLLTLVYTFWKPLTRKLGVPRTIITLFFIYLCLAAEIYNISVSLMLGNVLVRVGMYGILALAMLPGIQCGIGLNMGMTLGCIAGLLSTVISLQYDMTGAGALIFSCVLGALIAIPLGWAYSLLLNRTKGDEMTISTYVGFSFVSLMCIGWMLLPFTNTKIIWLLRGRGLRVTHSLLGSFAHLLDNFLAFKIFGVEIPTGLLLFFLLCCFIMWLFSRSKAGIAMSAAGSNPRFAEASGINVDRMRTLGTVLSTMIAAVGIVVYSQAFGYAQLYTAPRQLGFIAASAILIGGATVSKAKVSHVIIGVFLFEGVLALGQQIANAAVAGGGLSEVMRIMISNGIILYALTQSGGASRD